MPLSAAKPGLEAQIKQAFKKVLSAGKEDEANPDSVIDALAAELAEAIHTYTTQALVSTNINVVPGIPVATAGSPASQAGATTGPGTGTGTGNLS